jgi:xanthine dehydrogenase accessory factor
MSIEIEKTRVLVRGAGELATGVAWRLWQAKFPLLLTELPWPLTIRRYVAFSEAVHEGEWEVEGVIAQRIDDPSECEALWARRRIPLLVDPELTALEWYRPRVLIDATIAKRPTGITTTHAPLVLALGPGFEVGVHAHGVIETNRGHNMGRVLRAGHAEPDTGVPGEIGGYTIERVIFSPASGRFHGSRRIGDRIAAGDVIGNVEATPVRARIDGVLRGLIRDGTDLRKGMKMADVDPRGIRQNCFTLSDKALALGGGVLEAILSASFGPPVDHSEHEFRSGPV